MTDLNPYERECLLDEIRCLLPAPLHEETSLDGAVLLTGGEPAEVIARVSGSRVEVSEYGVYWDGPHTLVVRPRRIAALNWQRLPASRTRMLLQMLITTASEVRRGKYRPCQLCSKLSPPEWMHDQTTCQSCAQEHLGVVY